jgi:hypothetical protein
MTTHCLSRILALTHSLLLFALATLTHSRYSHSLSLTLTHSHSLSHSLSLSLSLSLHSLSLTLTLSLSLSLSLHSLSLHSLSPHSYSHSLSLTLSLHWALCCDTLFLFSVSTHLNCLISEMVCPTTSVLTSSNKVVHFTAGSHNVSTLLQVQLPTAGTPQLPCLSLAYYHAMGAGACMARWRVQVKCRCMHGVVSQVRVQVIPGFV